VQVIVLIDGINIKKYNLHSLRKKISLVMQEPNIFNYSILENILYGNLNASHTEVLKAAETANCSEFIEENNFKGTDDSSGEILRLMELKKDMIVELIGEDKYKEELEVMKKVVEQDEKKGIFAPE
jgi:ABC-type cobalamin/Fe3+-siderophores transport system ATPase subunit